jgi:uroporphyrinogen-III synthase
MPLWPHNAHCIIAPLTEPTPLSGLRILVTRPERRATSFIDQLQAMGGEALAYPVISITEPVDTHSREAALKNISRYEMAIFISPTAVEKTFEEIAALPASLKIIALGKSTARALKSYACALAFEAETQDSESLLAQPQMQAAEVKQQSIVIFRGEGGRELLADTLRERGAEVIYADIYRRALPDVEHLQSAQLDTLHAVCVTSNQGLENLVQLCDDLVRLKKLPLFVPGQRCADLAKNLGFRAIHIASGATDKAMLNALRQWAKPRLA